MAFQNMAFELVGAVSGLPYPLAQTKINEALGEIYDNTMWSFQFQEAGWITSGLLFPRGGTQSAGTITATLNSNVVVGDATVAAPAWLAYFNAGTLPFLTQCQIRSPYYSLYNIVAYDGVNSFTLDRPWTDPPGTTLAYMIYQAYFPVAVADFKRFIEMRDTTNNSIMDYWTLSRKDLALRDAERTIFDQPAYVVPYEVDMRGAGTPNASATLGYMMYELWPHPLSVLPYTYSFIRRGPALINPSDTLPIPLTEDLVKTKAYEFVYLWKEAQKGDGIMRGAGADFKYLSQAAREEYSGRDGRGGKLKLIRDRDRDLCEAYFNRYVRGAATGYLGTPFANINRGLNVGSWDGG